MRDRIYGVVLGGRLDRRSAMTGAIFARVPPDVRVVMEQRVSLGENGCKTECVKRFGSDTRAIRECHDGVTASTTRPTATRP